MATITMVDEDSGHHLNGGSNSQCDQGVNVCAHLEGQYGAYLRLCLAQKTWVEATNTITREISSVISV